MQVQVEEISPCRKKLHIEFPADFVAQEFGAVVKQIAAHARVQGFRPGKAPPRLVRTKFARQIQEEVRDRLLPQGYRNALEQEGLRPVAILDLKEDPLKEGEGFAFHVMCDVPPVFELPTYKGVKVKKETPEVTEENLDAVFNQLLDAEATYEDVERPVQDQDMVEVNYSGRCEKEPDKEQALADVGVDKAEGAWLLVDANTYLPGFRDALVGRSVGEKVQVVSLYPEDFARESLRGVEVVYEVEILAVREKKLPEVNEAFLQRFKVESEEELRLLLREDLERRAADQDRRRIEQEILGHLLNQTELDLPESEVQDETRETIYRMVRDVTKRGVSEEVLKEQKEKLFESASRTAADQVKLRYILSRIADEEKIEVDDTELNQEIRVMAMRQQVQPEQLRGYLKEKNLMENVRQDLRNRKTAVFLVEQADLVE